MFCVDTRCSGFGACSVLSLLVIIFSFSSPWQRCSWSRPVVVVVLLLLLLLLLLCWCWFWCCCCCCCCWWCGPCCIHSRNLVWLSPEFHHSLFVLPRSIGGAWPFLFFVFFFLSQRNNLYKPVLNYCFFHFFVNILFTPFSTDTHHLWQMYLTNIDLW